MLPSSTLSLLRAKIKYLAALVTAVCMTSVILGASFTKSLSRRLGDEKALPAHLRESDLKALSLPAIISFGKAVFCARWTKDDGAGRPFTKGLPSSNALSSENSDLLFPRNFNRISGPDASACKGCHNEPTLGSGGDRSASVFVLGQRFDFIDFERDSKAALSGGLDEKGTFPGLGRIANERRSIGMDGSGYIELLARQITRDLQKIRDEIALGEKAELTSKGISFGILKRRLDNTWDTSLVSGLSRTSISSSADVPPSLVVTPFHQSGAVVSLRQFTDNSFIQHFGIEPQERVGDGVDGDGDGVADELTRADVTAVVLFQATLPAPIQVVPKDKTVQRAVRRGENLFKRIGCANCHIPALPLDRNEHIFQEPGPYNTMGTAVEGETATVRVDLNSPLLPKPRLPMDPKGVVWVPAFTDMKLHDITSGRFDPNAEPLDQNEQPGSERFFQGNRKFITRRLWGVADSGPYMHHGKFTTLKEAIIAHAGEAEPSRSQYELLDEMGRASIIEFLKTLRIAPQQKVIPTLRSHRNLK